MSTLPFYIQFALGLVELILALVVYLKYQEEQNKLSLYLIAFFIFMFLGNTIVFIYSPVVLDQYAEMSAFILVFSVAALSTLFFFISSVLEVHRNIQVAIITLLWIAYLVHAHLPTYRIHTIFASFIIITSSILFFVGYKRHPEDGKSLGFGVHLLCLLVAEAIRSVWELQAVFFLLAIVFIILGFSGIFNKG